MTAALMAMLASFGAGVVDAVVGGGGLILVPAMFTLFPAAPPPTLFGTNKCAMVWGTASAAWHFIRRVDLRWPVLLPACACALIAAAAGAWEATRVDPRLARLALPLVLLALLAYTLWRRELGLQHSPHGTMARQAALASAIGTTVGFYDGFFGPGTGSVLVLLFVRWLGYDFVRASAAAKCINTATNLAALGWFAASGHVWWRLGAAMAVCNVAGSLLGSGLAIRLGVQFVRRVFILVVSVLVLKTGWDACHLLSLV